LRQRRPGLLFDGLDLMSATSPPLPAPAWDAPVRLDPIAQSFLWFERRVNVHSHQIAILEGALDAGRLREAISRAIAQFPLLLGAPDQTRRYLRPGVWRPSDAPLLERDFEGGEMTFANRAFRRFLMDASAAAPPPRWSEGPPVRFLLVRGTGRSCLLMGASHAVADALSDAALLETVGRFHAAQSAGNSSEASVAPAVSPISAADEAPELGRYRETASAAARGFLGAMALGFSRDIKLPWKPPFGNALNNGQAPALAPNASAEPPGALDFHVEALPDDLREEIKSAARAAGRKVNAVFCGALARLLWRMAPKRDQGRKVRFTFALSLRQTPPSADRLLPFGNFAVPCLLRLNANAPATALAREVEEQVQRLRSGKGLRAELRKSASLLPALRWGAPFPNESRFVRRVLGTNVFYSNPGVLPQPFREFGPGGPRVLEYAGLSAVLPPYSLTLYTPQVGGVLYLNALYRVDRFGDFAADMARPLQDELRRFARELLEAAS
jgi:NRPS condensation-like uncharacterized protein